MFVLCSTYSVRFRLYIVVYCCQVENARESGKTMAKNNRKHYSDIHVYDSRIVIDFVTGDNEGTVTVCLMNADPYYEKKEGRKAYAIAFERWAADAEGYMTRGKYNEALAYALGLSEAREAIERMQKQGN